MTLASPPGPAHDLAGLPAQGSTIAGKYRLGEVIGVGGMGVVFAGEHIELQQPVAVKLLLPRIALYPGARDRFVREARAAARIGGEHAVRILDVGTTEDGVAYLSMERLRGGDLAAVLEQRGPLPTVEAVDFLLQAIEGVSAAHAAGVVHRDLKPSNLFLAQPEGGRPVVKVLDFGISKTLTSPDGAAIQTLTHPNAPIGSPQYMAPEQIIDSRSVDVRADLWALGVILYELLSGRAPFQAASISHLYVKILHEPPVPLGEIRPDLPGELAQVIAACLAKDPAARVGSCADLRRALLPFASPRLRARLILLHDADDHADAPPPSSASVPVSFRAEGSMPAVASTDAFGATHLQAAEPARQRRLGLVVAAALVLFAGVGFAVVRASPAPTSGVRPSATPTASTTPPLVLPGPSAPAASAPGSGTTSAPPDTSAEPTAPPEKAAPKSATSPVASSSSATRPIRALPSARPAEPRPAPSVRVRDLGDIRPID